MMLKKCLQSSNHTEKNRLELLESLYQGPNFLLGCKNQHQLYSLWNCINSHSKLIFISCFFNNQLLNHLDLEIFLKANSLTYQTQFISLLLNSFSIYPLFLEQLNLLSVLAVFKQNQKNN